MRRKCKVCGKEFESVRGAAYCSDECRHNGKRVHPFGVKKICEWCKHEYMAKSNVQKYCSTQCYNKARYAKESGHMFKAKSPEERTRYCEVCGKKYVANMPHQKYCSPECKEIAKRDRAHETSLKWKVPSKKNKPKHESHIIAINEKARASGMSYGKWQAQKKLAVLHAQMERC